jgi:hypothetical protein
MDKFEKDKKCFSRVSFRRCVFLTIDELKKIMISIQMKIGKSGEKHDKITLNQFTLTTVIILILTLGSAADTSYKP